MECSDHYARAMASYGTFITACGFTYHGPTGSIGFEPKLNKTNFKAAFTTAEGWGTYTQMKKGKQQEHHFELKYGKLMLQNIRMEKQEKVKGFVVTLDKKPVTAQVEQRGTFVQVRLAQPVIMERGQVLTLTL